MGPKAGGITARREAVTCLWTSDQITLKAYYLGVRYVRVGSCLLLNFKGIACFFPSIAMSTAMRLWCEAEEERLRIENSAVDVQLYVAMLREPFSTNEASNRRSVASNSHHRCRSLATMNGGRLSFGRNYTKDGNVLYLLRASSSSWRAGATRVHPLRSTHSSVLIWRSGETRVREDAGFECFTLRADSRPFRWVSAFVPLLSRSWSGFPSIE